MVEPGQSKIGHWHWLPTDPSQDCTHLVTKYWTRPDLLCWALLGIHCLISLVCTASGSQAWQNLGQNKPRLATALGCHSTESQVCNQLTSKYCSRPVLNRVKYGVSRLFHPVLGPILHAGSLAVTHAHLLNLLMGPKTNWGFSQMPFNSADGSNDYSHCKCQSCTHAERERCSSA